MLLLLNKGGYCHKTQSCDSGGIASARGDRNTWTEIDADYRSDQYFIQHYGTGLYGPRSSRTGLTASHIDPNKFLFIYNRPDRYPEDYNVFRLVLNRYPRARLIYNMYF